MRSVCTATVAVCALAVSLQAQQPATSPSPIAFAIHGGAGTILRSRMTPENEALIRADLTRALTAGYDILKAGGTALDAVEAAIRILEDSPRFNAGKGAVVTSAGTFELDAAIMDGATLSAGSVAGVMHTKNPITLARRVMTRSPHVMLIGAGADAFAVAQGLDTVPNDYFRTEIRWNQYERTRDSVAGKLPPSAYNDPRIEKKYGTVGAIALDRFGNLAAGTSTGGTAFKRWGRVGDSPIIGAGTYASNADGCAVSATGTGEYFIRNTVAVDICKRVAYLHESIDHAATYVVMQKLVAQHGDGGVIAMDRRGMITQPFNTEGMYRGYVNAKGTVIVELYR